MTNKKDPICGMKGHIRAHGHYFCSKHCIKEYEKKMKLESEATTLSSTARFAIYSFVTIILISLEVLLYLTGYMIPFMGVFFILVSVLKMLDWKGFADAFSMYDIIAKRSRLYALSYPAIELLLGLAFIFNFYVKAAAVLVFVIMSVGTIGVAKNLLAKNPVKCACLGTLIKIPLTKFTLFEDIFMAIMALMVLLL